jgi:hypothetical protein
MILVVALRARAARTTSKLLLLGRPGQAQVGDEDVVDVACQQRSRFVGLADAGD